MLEASFQVFLLRPYFVHLGKRLVKAPKVYFTDTGALMETLVVAELFKTLLHRGEEPGLYFWRTAAGSEVDVIVEHQTRLAPIEIKASATPRPDMAREIAAFQRDFGERAAGGYVIYPGKTVLPLGGSSLAWPLAAL